MWNNRNHIAIGQQFRADIRITPDTFMDTFTLVRKRLEKHDTRFREAFPVEKSVAIAFRSSHHRCSMRKGVLRNFTKFTRKHLCQILFFNKVAGLRLATLPKKRPWRRCFSVDFAKFVRTRFFIEHLCTTVSVLYGVYRLVIRNASRMFAAGKSAVVSIIVYRNILSIFRESRVEQPKQLPHIKKPLTIKFLGLPVQFGLLELISRNPLFS